MSVQLRAVASQKFTWPEGTGLPPEVTVAVSVTTVFAGVVVTELPPAVTARVVTVAGGCPHSGKVAEALDW